MLRGSGGWGGGWDLLMRKSRKDACGCRIALLWGCCVYSSDMGLRQRISVSAP